MLLMCMSGVKLLIILSPLPQIIKGGFKYLMRRINILLTRLNHLLIFSVLILLSHWNNPYTLFPHLRKCPNSFTSPCLDF